MVAESYQPEAPYAPPRIKHLPHGVSSRADDVFEMAELVRFQLDPWQREVIAGACLQNADGRWAAKEVGVCVPRQNGKGGVLEVVELTSLFTWNSEFVIHSAHEFITSQRHFDRVWSLVQDTPDLLRRVWRQRPSKTHGQEGFRLVSGELIEFRTRTKGGGRGFSCDHLFLDEDMFLTEEMLGSLFPTLRARPNPQVWYTGSAVDQEVHDKGVVISRVRDRAIKGEDESLVYFEWSLDYDHPLEMPEEAFHDAHNYWLSNPAYGIRIFEDHFRTEIRTLDRRTSAVELFGVGDWVDPSQDENRPISMEAWGACEDKDSTIVSNLCIAFDVSPERRTSIAAAGKNADGKWHVEVLDKMPGTGWLPARLFDLVMDHSPEEVVYDSLGPGASMAAKAEEMGVSLRSLESRDIAQACGRIEDAVSEDNLRHLGSDDLWGAIRAATTRPLDDRWKWSRRKSTADISPLVAVTLALYAAMGTPEDDTSGVWVY